jgi:hypothetical protein
LIADDRPPQDLHLVGEHWTAWQPPPSFPEGTEIYTIQRGDTLWDLANRYYGNPYLWPQLWERNQYILDAHWIYPGDPLVVGVEVTPLAEMAEGAAEGMGEGAAEEGMGLDLKVAAPEALGSEDDIYCTGYIGERDERFPYKVAGSEHQSLRPGGAEAQASASRYGAGSSKLGLTTSDIVYVDGGRAAGMTAGEVHTVVAPEEVVRHPLTDGAVGRFYRYQGRLQILSVQDTSGIAEIVHACRPIGVGDSLKPFVAEPVPLARRSGMRGVNDPVSHEALSNAAAIVYSDSDLVTLGQGHVVFIDRGERDVTPGDIFSIYRVTPPGQPLLLVGELAVLSVNAEASLAKILESRYVVRIGDRLYPKLQ